MDCTGTLVGSDLAFSCTQGAVLSAMNEQFQFIVFIAALAIGLGLLLGIWKR